MKHFEIAGAWWVLQLDTGAALPEDSDGLCDADRRVITIREGMSDDRARMVLLHEVAHASCPYLTEDAIDALGLAQQRALSAYDDLTRFL